MGQSIQEWTKLNLWKTAFKKFEGIRFAQAYSRFNTHAIIAPFALKNYSKASTFYYFCTFFNIAPIPFLCRIYSVCKSSKLGKK